MRSKAEFFTLNSLQIFQKKSFQKFKICLLIKSKVCIQHGYLMLIKMIMGNFLLFDTNLNLKPYKKQFSFYTLPKFYPKQVIKKFRFSQFSLNISLDSKLKILKMSLLILLKMRSIHLTNKISF